jgi:phosphoribosylanthranilate isomerase
MKPYIGIAGITSREQGKALTDQFHTNAVGVGGRGYYGLIGYCLTSEMINADGKITNQRYIGLDDLKILNPKQPFGRNAIHYSPHPKNPDKFFIPDLINIFMGKNSEIYKSTAGKVLQINRAFNISADLLESVKHKKDGMFPDLEIIFQAGPGDITKMIPDELIARLRPYEKYISGILLDSSFGTGRKMDVRAFAPYIAALEKAFPDKILVFAGGLNPENAAAQIAALSRVTSRPFSIDVESGVRNEADELDLAKTETFIRRAAQQIYTNIRSLRPDNVMV